MKKLVAFTLLVFLYCGVSIAQHSGRGLPSSLFSTRLVLDSQEEIGLTKEQMKAVKNLVDRLNKETLAVKQKIATESDKLIKLLALTKIDERKALSSIERILSLGQRQRRSQLLHLIRLKNVLTEDQQNLLTEIRSRKGYK